MDIFDDIDGQRITAISYRQLMPRKGCDVHSGLLGHLFRDHQLARVFLGQVLKAACDVHGIANGGEMKRRAITHPTDNRGTAVNPDTDFERLFNSAASSRLRW